MWKYYVEIFGISGTKKVKILKMCQNCHLPPTVTKPDFCDCGMRKDDVHKNCAVIFLQCSTFLHCASEQHRVAEVEEILLQVVCSL